MVTILAMGNTAKWDEAKAVLADLGCEVHDASDVETLVARAHSEACIAQYEAKRGQMPNEVRSMVINQMMGHFMPVCEDDYADTFGLVDEARDAVQG